MSIIPPCKHCGGTTIYRNCRPFGNVQEIFGSDGTHVETSTERLNWSSPMRARCEDCRQIRTDIKIYGMSVVVGAG